VGDFDPQALAADVAKLFGNWNNPYPFSRVAARYFDAPPVEEQLATPDKANAVLRGGENLRMRDDDRDFPALLLANYLLGGTIASRIPARVREKEGLSYSVYSSFSASSLDPVASFRVAAIFAPQNRARVEQAVREELARALKGGFSAEEVETGKKGLLQARRLARTQDRALTSRLASYLFIKRSFAWDRELEARIAALTPAEVDAALRKYIDPAKLSLVMAGDFKK
jgi:zinc protease